MFVRRYGLIQPTRTESGHRLYSKADIETVKRILDWIERGVAVSKVGKILARDDQQAQAVRAERDLAGESEWPQWQARLMQAVSAFDDRQLEHVYGQIFATYPLSAARPAPARRHRRTTIHWPGQSRPDGAANRAREASGCPGTQR